MPSSIQDKIRARGRRRKRVRKKVFGTPYKPRLCVYKSNRYIYAQLIDDIQGITVASASSLRQDGEKEKMNYKSVEDAEKVGENLGKIAAQKGIKKLVFDRSGYPYCGKIKVIADKVREQGIKF